jgi:hypothetical protein
VEGAKVWVRMTKNTQKFAYSVKQIDRKRRARIIAKRFEKQL